MQYYIDEQMILQQHIFQAFPVERRRWLIMVTATFPAVVFAHM